MATFLIRTVTILFAASSFLISTASSVDPFEAFFVSPSPPPPLQQLSAVTGKSFYSLTFSLSPILSHLGFQDLAAAVPSLSAVSWNGPSTLFAPSDFSLRTCPSCFAPDLLREHIVPGLFTSDYLRKLAVGTKIETLSPGRCITISSDNVLSSNGTVGSTATIFVGGVAVVHPDLFNNGLVVVHGIQGSISPLSPFSCDDDRTMTVSDRGRQPVQLTVQAAIMRLMLREAMLRLRYSGFSILSLAMKVKFAELMNLNNMTMFALDDASIFTGSHGYIGKVRFHIVPNQYLTIRDLESLPVGTMLPTLETGKSLVITTAGGEDAARPMRINFVRIKGPDMMRNLKIVVHSLFFALPHVNPEAAALDGIAGRVSDSGMIGHGSAAGLEGVACTAVEENGNCAVPVNLGEVIQDDVKPTVEIEDHHGL